MPPVKKRKSRPRPVYFETTVPVVRNCRSCGVWLAAGVAEGVKAEIELVPLDTVQRLWCVVNRIQMYAMRRSGLIRMDAGRLTDPRFKTLFPQHHCHIGWPAPVSRASAISVRRDIPPY